MSRMSKLKYAVTAALLVSTLWAQTPVPTAANSAAPPPASQSQPPDASAPLASSAPPAATPPPDSTRLELIKKVKPEYPPAAAPDKLQGQVIVRIVVDETGDVDSSEVISGNPVLAAAAVDAVKQWKFKPFIKNGQPVKAAVKLPFDFTPPADAVPDASPKPADTNAPPAKTDETTPSAPPKIVRLQVVPAKPDGQNLDPLQPGTLRVTKGEFHGKLIYSVEPTYPSQARQMRIQGTVVLRAVISREGTIEELHVVSGHPLLIDAAIDAVK
jgi:TonB family protein